MSEPCSVQTDSGSVLLQAARSNRVLTDVPLNESDRFVEDALDLLAFANGQTSNQSSWGGVRRQMGHEAPFALTRLEIGNEERVLHGNDGYAGHYKLIADRLWATHPDLVIIASGRWLGPSVDGSPCMNGARCDVWDEHFYETPDAMAAMGKQYDSYNRSWPAVFVGEYAANKPEGAPTLRAAIAESVFMLGLERNADVVWPHSPPPERAQSLR